MPVSPLGLGAGWNVPEHEAFGIPLPAPRPRIEALEDGEVAKFEVLVREESFNQTATEVPFVLCI